MSLPSSFREKALQIGSGHALAALSLTFALACDTRHEIQPVAAPPAYMGSLDASAACQREYKTSGFEPQGSAGARYPLFLYFVGTNIFGPPAGGNALTDPAIRAVTEAMARRGFVALSAEYDNTTLGLVSDHRNQLQCLFAAQNSNNLLAKACALPHVNCDLGIATWGHSQGALVAHMAGNYDPRVRAVWTTGYGGDEEGLFKPFTPATLPDSRLRVVNGEADLAPSGTPQGLTDIAGMTESECPLDGRVECLRQDGSGWVQVRKADLAAPSVSSADHCWFDRRSCLDTNVILEPNWVSSDSSLPFALESNADWVARTARRL
ncbi:MAG TPA: hypothetical protein VK524_20770 [Polyangiaceae bacterium]|nr:hypothetical protein [Polyangiaceae bacterium]